MADWLPDKHLIWFVLDVVAQLDTAVFHATRKTGGVGRQFSRDDGVLACCGAGGRLRDGIWTVGSALAKPRADLRAPGLADSCRRVEPSQQRQGAAAVRVV